MKTHKSVLCAAALLASLSLTGAQATPTLYATSTDSSTGFFAYHPTTNTWSTKASIATRAQLAADQNGDVWALADDNTIKRYDEVNDQWDTVAPGPGIGNVRANLEVLNDGRFFVTEYNDPFYRVYDGVSWSSGLLGFDPGMNGDYDPFTDTLVIGSLGNETTHQLDTTTFAKTTFSVGAGGAGEIRRAGSVLDGKYYIKENQFSDLKSFDLASNANPLTDLGDGPSTLFYPASAADRENNLLYLVGIGGANSVNHDVDVYDPSTGQFTALADSPAALGFHSTAVVGGVVPEPTGLAFFALGLPALARRRRR
jgi:hypothetical protein